ncbi:MAG: uroporphyrinogen-III synthase [Planctomycetota bacterium]
MNQSRQVCGSRVTVHERRHSSALRGRRILVTRPRDGGNTLRAELRARGAVVVEAPVIQILPPRRCRPLRRAARAAGDFDGILFTSANAVRAFFAALPRGARHGGRSGRPCLAAVGEVTVEALRQYHHPADIIPKDASAAGLLRTLRRVGVRGKRFLWPRSAIAGREFAVRLRAAGARVTEIVAYRTVGLKRLPARARRSLRAGEVDIITLASPSAARHLLRLAGAAALARIPCVSIGPVTTKAARALGFSVAAEARPRTAAGIAAAAGTFFHRSRKRSH